MWLHLHVKREENQRSFDVAFLFLIWSLQVMSARLSSWDSPSVPARAGRGAGIKSPPLHLIRPKTFSEARLEPADDYLTSRPTPPPAVGWQPSPPRASCVPLKSEKQRHCRSSAVFIHIYIYMQTQNTFKLAVTSGFLTTQQACELLSPSPSHACILSALNH